MRRRPNSHLASRISYPRPAVVIALLLLLIGVAPRAAAPRAAAHGIGTPQVLNAPAGPYLLSAWTDPDPLRADETHVVVAVSDPATREPIVAGVAVRVTLTSLADPAQSVTEIAATDNVNRLLYAAEFNDRVTAGRWRVDLAAGGDRGRGEGVSFEVEIEPARGFNWLWVGLGGLAVVVAAWVAVSLRRPPAPAAAAP